MIEFLDLGVAGILAVALFFFLRHLVGQMRQDRMFMEDRMTIIIQQYHEDSEHRTKAQEEHTKVLSELKTWLQARNGKSKE